MSAASGLGPVAHEQFQALLVAMCVRHRRKFQSSLEPSRSLGTSLELLQELALQSWRTEVSRSTSSIYR